MKGRTPRQQEQEPKEEVLFDYDRQQEIERRRWSRFIADAAFLDKEEGQPKEKTKKGYQTCRRLSRPSAKAIYERAH